MLTIHDFDTPSELTWHIVIQGMRNSWESQEKSDSCLREAACADDYVMTGVDEFVLGDADKALCLRLIKAGTDHGKFMRQLPIVVDMTAPETFYKQLETYKVGTTRNSTSTMHTLGKHEITADMFSWEHMSQDAQDDTLRILNNLRTGWIDSGKRKGPEQYEWDAFIEALPMGFNYRSCWSANYQVLRSIYHARKHHRLGLWRVFCAWIETLPYQELIITDFTK